uniref:Integrator complex subunit 12 n=1 Tax=Romanomermis culicivorax TaxID=13658 RepID=A0A915HKH8_ROMCU
MELDDQFYQKVIRLVATDLKNTEANEELFHIFQQVKQHYVENGITELWRPIMSGTAGVSGSDFLEVPISSKRQSIAPVRRESLLSESDFTTLVGQPKSPAHNSVIDNTKNPPPLIYDSCGTIFSNVLKSELLSADEQHSLSTNDFDDLQDSSSVEPLRLVANFEENDESVNVVVEQSSTKLPKVESDNKDLEPKAALGDIPLDVSTLVDVASSTAIVDDIYLNAQSPKIRRLAHEKRSDSPSIVKVKNLEKVKTFVKQEISEEPIMQNTCATCKSTTFTLGNSLVECHQCHIFYHQKCHTPNVPQSHINDPRSLWYCAICSKKMKKTVAIV